LGIFGGKKGKRKGVIVPKARERRREKNANRECERLRRKEEGKEKNDGHNE